MSDNKNWRFATRAVRSGQERSQQGEQGEPIYTTSSFVFDTAEAAADRFAGRTEGNIYSRFTNPTVRMFEKRLAALEGGESCVATGSGMVAILAACMALLKAGDHVVSSRSIFGSTTLLFTNYLARFGIETDFVDLKDLDAWEAAIKDNTRLLFIETPSNPLLEIVDISALADIAHQHDCLLVVDNTLCTAALQLPLELGADLSIVSTTKYIDGQGRTVGGAVVGNKELVGTEVYGFQRTCGPAMSPFNAWVALKGLETLELRMEAHSQRALQLAQWLESHEKVKRVYYTGLKSHPQFELAQKQQRAGGGVLSFEIDGGQEMAWKLCDATQLVSITANLGDTKTILTHPATTTHGRVSPEVRAAAGISDGLLRVAVGLEDVEDLKADLQRGFDAIG